MVDPARWRFLTDCIDAPAYFGSLGKAIDALESFDDARREISVARFVRLIGAGPLRELSAMQGYAWGRERGLRLAQDYHVRAYRGRFNGKPALCLMWSAIHFLFVKEKNS